MNITWKSNIRDYENVTLDAAKFTFSQAEAKLKDLLATADDIVKRFTQLTIFQVALLTAILGFAFPQFQNEGPYFWSCAIILIYLFTVLLCTVWQLRFRNYATLGSEPKLLFDNIYFDSPATQKLKDMQAIYMYILEIEQYQRRIEENRAQNLKRTNIYNYCLLLTAATPGILLVTHLLSSFVLKSLGCCAPCFS